MNAPVSLHAPKPCILGAQSVSDLWVLLGHCDGTVARLEDQLNEQATHSLRYVAIHNQLEAWRAEKDAIEAELTARFLSWAGGVDLNAFVARLG